MSFDPGDRKYRDPDAREVFGGIVSQELAHPLRVDLLHQLNAHPIAFGALDLVERLLLRRGHVDVERVDHPPTEAAQALCNALRLPEQGLFAGACGPRQQNDTGQRRIGARQSDGKRRALTVAEHEDSVRVDVFWDRSQARPAAASVTRSSKPVFQ